MFEWSDTTRHWRGALACMGLGFLAGGLEMVGHAATVRLPIGFVSFALIGLANVAIMGAVAGLFGLVTGLVHRARRGAGAARNLALQMALCALLLCGWYLWEAAAVLLADGRSVAAGIMAVMPAVFAAVVFYNAAYWWRRLQLGRETTVGWLPVAFGTSLVLVLGTAAGFSARDTGGGGALEGDPNVVLVTVDGLRHDAVFGGGVLGEQAKRSIRFRDAVTPMPDPVAAAVTVHTALHPLRHGVLGEGDAMGSAYRTLAEVMADEGWATGAFLSDRALGGAAGLDQGFRTVDDGVPGWLRLSALRRLPLPRPRHRPDPSTVDAFERWFARHQLVPFFAWVHLSAPVTGDRDAGTGTAEAQVARIEALLSDAGLSEATAVVVVGTFGWMDGEHGVTGTTGLWDPLVRVPLLVRAPGVDPVLRDVPQQVRLMDVSPTVLGYVKLDAPEPGEGVNVLGYATGVRRTPMWCSLVGRSGDDLFGTALLGMRNNGIKYIREVRTGTERLFDLDADPDESEDLSDSHHTTLEQARGLVAPEETALRKLLLEGR